MYWLENDGNPTAGLWTEHAITAVDGNPNSANFGEITWQAEGLSSSLPGADYSPPAGNNEGFERQHNASLQDGDLWLFDNTGVGSGSRAAHYTLDSGSGEVRHVESWSVGRTCPIEGGAVPLGTNGVLATCPENRRIQQFVSGQSDAIYTLDTSCAQIGPQNAINRGIPVMVE